MARARTKTKLPAQPKDGDANGIRAINPEGEATGEVVTAAAPPAPPLLRAGQLSGRAPDPNVRLRVVVQEVMDIRTNEGPQRRRFKAQVAAYAMLGGPRLPRDLVAILEVSCTTVNHYADATIARMASHWGFRIYVKEAVAKMADRFAHLE